MKKIHLLLSLLFLGNSLIAQTPDTTEEFWTKDRKTNFYEDCKDQLKAYPYAFDAQKRKACYCWLEKVMDQYPSSEKFYADSEAIRNDQLETSLQQCARKNGIFNKKLVNMSGDEWTDNQKSTVIKDCQKNIQKDYIISSGEASSICLCQLEDFMEEHSYADYYNSAYHKAIFQAQQTTCINELGLEPVPRELNSSDNDNVNIDIRVND